jgi:OmpA-OmpF porin, OOP family
VNQHKQLALSIALIGASCSTMAQDSAFNPSWYIQPSVSAFRPDNDFGLDSKTTGFGAGLKFGRAISDHWDVQMGYVYGRAKDNGDRNQQHLLGVDGLYLFSRQTFRPFFLIGAGVERDRIRLSGGTTSQTAPYASIGAGVQAVLSDRVTLQADLRNVHGFGGNKFDDLKSNNYYLTVGLNIAFNAPPTPAPAAAPPVAPAMLPEPAPVAPPPPPPPARFEKVSLSATELFAFDSAKLNSNQPKLDDIANLLNANSSVTNVAISGYADRLGNDNYNQKLSERRANAVKDYLISKGVAASRLNAAGKGESNPVVECKDKNRAALIKCLEPNRRVEVEQITVERRVQ